MADHITKQDILAFQKAWGENVVKVGQLFLQEKDYTSEAQNLVKKFYGYGESAVLFKPTRASLKQFRTTPEGAVAYFVGSSKDFPEDTGFALQPWTNVRFENTDIILNGNQAISMGNYFFTDLDGDEKKVEYTMGCFCTEKGEIKINLHHSSVPYSPTKSDYAEKKG
jgi:hypothetical protein